MAEIEVICEPPFNWSELNGKVLLIQVRETPDGSMVIGMETDNPENLYILHWDLPRAEGEPATEIDPLDV